tara:strand:+ start:152 stop:1033 length:882 start_codon:yes stop_codon:yes gene_type:complete
MKNASLSYEQYFYVNGTGLSGVQSINGSYGVSERPINILGYGYVNHILDGPLQGNFTIDRVLVNQDAMLNMTGENAAFSGVVSYNAYGSAVTASTGSFGFYSGYLTSYKLSCDVESLPEVSTTVSVYGDLGRNLVSASELGAKDSDSATDNAINLPDQGSITISCSELNTVSNRIVSLNHEISCQREPVYALPTSAADAKAKYPVQVDLVYPLEQTTNLTLEIDDYQTKNLYDYLTGVYTGNVNIDINGSSDNAALASFHLDNARLVNESFSSSVGGVATVNMTFKKYINKRR